jgi:hypothetical protein
MPRETGAFLFYRNLREFAKAIKKIINLGNDF